MSDLTKNHHKIFERFVYFVRTPIFWVSLITILGALLRRYHLGRKSLWVDEAILYHISQGSILDIFSKNAKLSSAPPLYPIFLHFVQLFGDSELILRGVALVFGILAIPISYFMLRKFVGTWGAIWTTLLIAVAPQQIYYSQQVREYSLTFFMSVGMILVLARYIKSGSTKNLICLSIVWTIGIWIQYGLSIFALSLNFIYGIFWIKNLNWVRAKRWIIGQSSVVASIVQIFFLGLQTQYVPGGSGIQYLSTGYWAPGERGMLSFVVQQTSEIIKFALDGSQIFLGILIIGLLALIFAKYETSGLIWIFTPFAVAILFGLIRMYPYLGSRHNIYLTPILYLLFAFGVDYLFRIDKFKIIGVTLTIFLAINSIKANIEYYESPGVENIRPVLSQLRNQKSADERVYVYYASEWAYRYYMRDDQQPWISGKWHRNNAQLYLSEIDPLIHNPKGIWFVFSHCYQDECNMIRDYVSAERPLELIAQQPDVYLYYAKENLP